jgi:hypothetical protein
LKTPCVPISWGELVDKITILEIKLLKIFNNKSRDNIEKELKYLEEVADFKNMPEEIKDLKLELKTVNHKLWVVEDSIRDKDLLGEFDDTFLELARSVYRLNDLRARLKKSINLNLKSELVEEKSYKNFQN